MNNKLFFTDKFSKHLKGESLQLLEYSIKVLTSIIGQLMDGGIVVKDLQTILEKRDNFQKIVQSMKDVSVTATMLTLNLRQIELQAYMDTLKVVQEFTNFSIYCKGKTFI